MTSTLLTRLRSWFSATWSELDFRSRIAAVGLGLACVGPLLCFLLWAAGRDGDAAIGFSLIFISMGFIAIWVAGGADEEEDAEPETAITESSATNAPVPASHEGRHQRNLDRPALPAFQALHQRPERRIQRDREPLCERLRLPERPRWGGRQISSDSCEERSRAGSVPDSIPESLSIFHR